MIKLECFRNLLITNFNKYSVGFRSLDSPACWAAVCNEYETDEVQSVLSARVLDARKENARAYSARGKNFHFGHFVLTLRAPKALRTVLNKILNSTKFSQFRSHTNCA